MCAALQVREAMASLLVATSKTRTLHFYEVVPLDVLLAVMASDVPAVSQRIQQMLVPSYFPNPTEGSVSTGSVPAQHNPTTSTCQ